MQNDSKFKMQKNPNKTMFLPSHYNQQLPPRQSITPQGSTLSIERASDKLQEEGINEVADFPSLRQSIHSHSNKLINEKTRNIIEE